MSEDELIAAMRPGARIRLQRVMSPTSDVSGLV